MDKKNIIRAWKDPEYRASLEAAPESPAGVVESLWKNDVPFFHTRTDSAGLFDHEDRHHPDLLARSCLEEVVGHIRRLDEGDLQRQVWFIRGSMACQRVQPGHTDIGAKGTSFNHSLCHGDLGNLELLLEAHQAGHPVLGENEVDYWRSVNNQPRSEISHA